MSIDVKAEDKEDDGGEGDDGSDHDLAIKVVAILWGPNQSSSSSFRTLRIGRLEDDMAVVVIFGFGKF